jgi:hypothetical protein
MRSFSRLLRAVAALYIFIGLAAAGSFALADTIKLKNGSVIKGRVVSFTQGEFTIILDLGTASRKSTSRMIIAAEDVESIEFDGTDAGGASPRSSSASETTAEPERTAEKVPDRAAEKPAEKAEEVSESKPRVTATPPAEPEPDATTPSSSSGLSVLAEKDVRVAAAADWTSSDIRVMKGQRLFITAEGEVDLGNDRKSGPAGVPVSDTRKLMTNRPTGSLIAVIGDDNDNFIYIGKSAEFIAANNGVLFLSVNEGELKDNTGSYRAKVKVMAAK